jgi:hypothetical protein
MTTNMVEGPSWSKGRLVAKRHLSIRAVLVAVGVGVAAWLGWSYYQSRYPSWKEEVQLSDGRVLLVKQERQYFENYGTNQSWVTFSLPELGGQQTWQSYLRPQRVDVYGGKVYVFGAPRGIRQYRHYKYPRYFMVAFIWSGSEFQRIPFMDVPSQIRSVENIFPCVPKDHKAIVTLKDKEAQWCPPTGDKSQFTRQIDVREYVGLAEEYSRLDGGKPLSE